MKCRLSFNSICHCSHKNSAIYDRLFIPRKLAALRIALEGITRKRRNAYRSHHTSGEPTDLATLKNIYVELAALRSYCDLNQTGFYKIIKKYDKVMEVSSVILSSVQFSSIHLKACSHLEGTNREIDRERYCIVI